MPTPTSVQAFGDQLVGAMGDSVEANRNAAADALGTLTKLVGERAMAAKIDALDDVRKAKVREAMEKATVKAKPGKAPPPAAAPKPVQAASVPNAAKPAPPAFSSAPSLKREAPESKPVTAPRGPPARLLVSVDLCLNVRQRV